jgi:hypothetical protein
VLSAIRRFDWIEGKLNGVPNDLAVWWCVTGDWCKNLRSEPEVI